MASSKQHALATIDAAWDGILQIAQWMTSRYAMPADFVPALERVRVNTALMPPTEGARRIGELGEAFQRVGEAALARDGTAEQRLQELYNVLLIDTN